MTRKRGDGGDKCRKFFPQCDQPDPGRPCLFLGKRRHRCSRVCVREQRSCCVAAFIFSVQLNYGGVGGA